jgi:microcystin degradation protein MlrC
MTASIRFGIACLMQESNTFAPSYSTLKDFAVEQGQTILASNQGTNTEIGGFLDELNVLGVEAVPLISVWAVSAGPVEDATFDYLADQLLKRIQGLAVDGLLIALHGAWLGASHSSADAEVVKRVREVVGPDLPIVITLDSHANVMPSLLQQVDGVVGYRTYPHVDMAETGRKATRMLFEIVTQRFTPRLYWVPIPLLSPPQSATTDRAPIQEILERLDRELPASSVLSSSLFYVQPWLDMKGVNSSLVVVTRDENPQVKAIVSDIAQELWDRREEFHVDWAEPGDLVSEVMREPKRPVMVSEAFDSPSGGAPGDNPGLLSILLPHQNEVTAALFLVDPRAAERAFEIGVGGEYAGPLGASGDQRYGDAVFTRARVRQLSDGRFVLKGPVFTGRNVSMGRTAVLEAGGIRLVVASLPVFVIDPELYRSQGIEPAEQDIVAVKSPSLFRPGYASMLHRVLDLDMPGVCRGNLIKVPFQRINRPIFPLDEFTWKASEQSVLSFAPGQRTT